MSLDDGDHWQSLEYNLPHSSMRDLWIEDNDLIVATHGRSFWILDDISPLRQLPEITANAGAFLFKPGAAYRVRRSTYTDTPLPIDEPAGQNPPDGAAIDYYLPPTTTGIVSLEIIDADDKLVRKYSSADPPYATREELSKQLIPLYWLKMPESLPSQPGMHRWVWDLRYSTPVATRYEYPISAVPHETPRVPQGALALPGTYKVRLTVDGRSMTASLTVKIDPRVRATPADLEGNFQLESKLSAIVNSSSEASLQAHSIREQAEKLSKSLQPSPSASTREKLEAFDKQLAAALSGDERPGSDRPGLDAVAGEAGALYLQVGQADAAPTAAQHSAAAHLTEESAEVLKTWVKLKSVSLAELNRQLRSDHLPELNPEQRPETMPEGGDED
jgi:hypothetical protein